MTAPPPPPPGRPLPPGPAQVCGNCRYDRSAVPPMAPCPECGRHAHAPHTPSREELKACAARRERHLMAFWALIFVVALVLAVGVVVYLRP